MARKGRSNEEVIAALREAEVRIGQGETVGKICRSLGVSEQTYYMDGSPDANDLSSFPANLGAKIYPASPVMLARPKWVIRAA